MKKSTIRIYSIIAIVVLPIIIVLGIAACFYMKDAVQECYQGTYPISYWEGEERYFDFTTMNEFEEYLEDRISYRNYLKAYYF